MDSPNSTGLAAIADPADRHVWEFHQQLGQIPLLIHFRRFGRLALKLLQKRGWEFYGVSRWLHAIQSQNSYRKRFDRLSNDE